MRSLPYPLICFLSAALALAVYLFTLAPDLTWANFGSDGGELITAAMTWGVPHPPGYPTYVLLGHLVGWLPFGTAVYRFNLFSAVCVAGAVGLVTAVNLWFVVGDLSPSAGDKSPTTNTNATMPAVAAGLTFAFAPLVWGQALVSEVYALNLFCLALFLWALLTVRPCWLVGLFLGLSITTHLTSLLMLPLALVGCGRRQRQPLMVGLMIGLLPFLLLPLFAQSGSPVQWGEPDTLRGWWWLVSAQIYRPNLFAVSPALLLSRLANWAILLPAQFLWFGFFCAALGLAKFRKPYAVSREPTMGFGLRIAHHASRITHHRLPITTLFTITLYLLYALVYNTPDAVLFTLPALLLAAMFLGLGLRPLRQWSLLLPLCLLLLNFQGQDLSQGVMVRPSATALLQAAPPHALLVSSDSGATFSLWYFVHVEKQRPDVVIVDSNLFAFDWHRRHLAAQHPTLFVPAADDLPAFYAQNGAARPLCFAQLTPEAEPAFGLECKEEVSLRQR
ncbi:MAG: hypothetical protein BroJett015_08040 [Chloroflexota bacterium]|nr:DUF2723 domain-containing protein [Ardenticatenaceae bacterium]GIK55141.1 MAG: hypothetical protein BroJett015_08040 [Chloroflexota bacterium]